MQYFKKTIAILLTTALLLTLAPLGVLAKNNDETQNVIYLSAINLNSSVINSTSIVTELSLIQYLDELIATSEDAAASYSLNEITTEQLEFYKEFSSNNLPTHTFTLTYTDNNLIITQSETYYANVIQENVPSVISPLWIESAFDIGMFTLSVVEFNQTPSFWNGFWVVADGASIVFPGIPALSGVKRMMQDSPDVLKPALEKGIRKYSELQNIVSPANFFGLGWERHHIFEKRFASKLGTTAADMFSIFIPKYDYHYQITQRMSSKIPWWEAPFWSRDDIIQAHINAYEELWAESGFTDAYWEFLYKWTKNRNIAPGVTYP